MNKPSPNKPMQSHSSGVASYARYSSNMQDARSITDQQRKCRDRAARDGLEISPELQFADEAISGASAHRPQFESLKTAIEEKRIKVLIVESLSRVARDNYVSLGFLRFAVGRHKVHFISIDDGIDTAINSNWELSALFLGYQNEQYLKTLADHVFRTQWGLADDGYAVGDHCFGYKTEEVPGTEQLRKGRKRGPLKTYVIDETNAKWVQKIFSWYADPKYGYSLAAIARKLNEAHAPKDHRSTKKRWHHQSVSNLLANKKYIGIWTWALKKNCRDSLTLEKRAEPRPEGDPDRLERRLPYLQIVDEDAFFRAQLRLAQNRERRAQFPARKGGFRSRESTQLNGYESSLPESYPRHLLSGLVICGECGSTFIVGGSSSAYMFCRAYRQGGCSCKTMLPRKLAERLTLDVVSRQILDNEHLHLELLERVRVAWQKWQQGGPAEIEAIEKALAEVERKINSLVDKCENGSFPEFEQRLGERRAERDQLRARLDEMIRRASEFSQAPTKEWIDEQLKELGSILAEGGTAAAVMLKDLVPGGILVTEKPKPDSKDFYLEGSFRLAIRKLPNGHDVPDDADMPAGGSAEHTVEFREPAEFEVLADAVKAAWDDRKTINEIAADLGKGKTLVTHAWRYWYVSRGETRLTAGPVANGWRRRCD